MEVVVSGKYHGQAPYEMHSIDIKLTDEDFCRQSGQAESQFEDYVSLTLEQRIDLATEIAGIRCVLFGVKKGCLTKEEAKKQIQQLRAKAGNGNGK